MKASLALLCCLTAVVSGFVVELNDDEFQWNAWKTYHDKIYDTASEENVRRAIWRDNLKKIAQHNSQGHSHVLGMNHLGDLTQDEFRFHYLGMRGHLGSRNTTGGTTYLPASHVTLPIEVDWRKEGYVTEVKNQGQCGSCWAFSATGSLEGQHFRKTGKLVSLSEQNLVDCSMKFGNHGCRGGLMDYAFKFIKANGGVDTEASYPYKARDEACWFANRDVGATVTGFVDIPEGSEESLQLATATIGPISVAIDAGHFSFQFYRSGVYNERRCSSTRLNHGVLAVGYGTFQGKDYWLVKNSWGVEWGMDGYMMMSRNKNNQCGIATYASYPLV